MYNNSNMYKGDGYNRVATTDKHFDGDSDGDANLVIDQVHEAGVFNQSEFAVVNPTVSFHTLQVRKVYRILPAARRREYQAIVLDLVDYQGLTIRAYSTSLINKELPKMDQSFDYYIANMGQIIDPSGVKNTYNNFLISRRERDVGDDCDCSDRDMLTLMSSGAFGQVCCSSCRNKNMDFPTIKEIKENPIVSPFRDVPINQPHLVSKIINVMGDMILSLQNFAGERLQVRAPCRLKSSILNLDDYTKETILVVSNGLVEIDSDRAYYDCKISTRR